ncbi:ModD protein [Paenalcaligenes sp. Me131]|uniref:ModD protein n=1 Tax=Paenalcaligenes sp. Me131 TaxID=3392636 RepID=UPI003D29EFD0
MSLAPVYFDNAMLEDWLQEDIGYLDLTSTLLQLGNKPARITWRTRGATVSACTEEVVRLLQSRQVTHIKHLPSGQHAADGDILVEAEGPAQALLDVWKVGQNLLEYACSVALRTHQLVEAVKQLNPHVGILTTRKHPPGLRRIAVKSTMAGGAWPHRLGLSETILVFPQHRALLAENGWTEVKERLRQNANGLAEKKVVIEAATLEETLLAVEAGADVIQFDKVAPAQLREWCAPLRERYPSLKLLAAGGINKTNAADYANCGVDGLVTSSLYYGPPADISVSIQKI